MRGAAEKQITRKTQERRGKSRAVPCFIAAARFALENDRAGFGKFWSGLAKMQDLLAKVAFLTGELAG